MEDLNAVHEEQTNVKAMMQDVLRRVRDSVEAAGLRSVSVGSQGLQMLGHLALGFSEIARHLEALPVDVQVLATQEGRALAQGVAENILACYRSWTPPSRWSQLGKEWLRQRRPSRGQPSTTSPPRWRNFLCGR